ncbi:MAG: VOC family protein [Alphaproteobacteria bacterium]|nr:VOC family protein [Alphaproteobacteria bacterium]
MRLARNVLRIGQPERSLAFYTDALGMALTHRGRADGETVLRLAYPSRQGASPTELELRHRPPSSAAAPAASTDLHSYWKIGITLADVDLARTRLKARGVAVSEPKQFEDIGYLCHLADPDGHAIELLQHRFAANHVPVTPRDDVSLGSDATFGQITLRVKDAEAALRFYRDRLGLTLLSRQPVPRRRFTLYFLAAVADTPPNPDLEAVANREWLWQRPYTTLELQHHWGAEDGAARWAPQDGAAVGFGGVVIETNTIEPGTLRDPDGNRVYIEAPPA